MEEVSGEAEHRMIETLAPPRRSNEGWRDKPVGKTNPRVLVAAMDVSQSFTAVTEDGNREL